MRVQKYEFPGGVAERLFSETAPLGGIFVEHPVGLSVWVGKSLCNGRARVRQARIWALGRGQRETVHQSAGMECRTSCVRACARR